MQQDRRRSLPFLAILFAKAAALGRQGLLAMVLVVPVVQGAAAENAPSVRLTCDGRVIDGMPVAWSARRILLLERTGQLWNLAVGDVQRYEALSGAFQPISQRAMRGLLLREFGRSYEVSGTGHYLVVHQAGRGSDWCARFEELYRSFTQYFNARSLRVADPEFPLVAVVFPSWDVFRRYAAAQGTPVSANISGFYSVATNRILLYEQGMGGRGVVNRRATIDTIFHEATHQIAFNTSVHCRYALPPLWVAEGLAMMFEAPGMYDARHYGRLADRVNRNRLAYFQQHLLQHRPADRLKALISRPARAFQADPPGAYAEAWAFSFFLSQKEPIRYARYLKETARRTPLHRYGEAEQLDEFTRVFGNRIDLLEARYLRFIREVLVELRR